MTPSNDEELKKIITAVKQSSKYNNISLDLVEHIGTQELERRKSTKEAIKGTKNRLHQIAGAYFSSQPNYQKWHSQLRSAAGNQGKLKAACRSIMGNHVSTKERLSILDEFYKTIFKDLPRIYTILDLACGLNPLAIPWLPKKSDVRYHAVDIYTDLAEFYDEIWGLLGVDGNAYSEDITTGVPQIYADLAILVKAVPCLEQLEKNVGINILQQVKADYVLVSFPSQSIGGKSKGMAQNYTEQFKQMVEGTNWTWKQYTFATEQAFLIEKD